MFTFDDMATGALLQGGNRNEGSSSPHFPTMARVACVLFPAVPRRADGHPAATTPTHETWRCTAPPWRCPWTYPSIGCQWFWFCARAVTCGACDTDRGWSRVRDHPNTPHMRWLVQAPEWRGPLPEAEKTMSAEESPFPLFAGLVEEGSLGRVGAHQAGGPQRHRARCSRTCQ